MNAEVAEARLALEQAAKRRIAEVHADEPLLAEVREAYEEVQADLPATPWEELRNKR